MTLRETGLMWLRDHAKERRRCERSARKALAIVTLNGARVGGPYAHAIRTLADAHATAALAYESALEAEAERNAAAPVKP